MQEGEIRLDDTLRRRRPRLARNPVPEQIVVAFHAYGALRARVAQADDTAE